MEVSDWPPWLLYSRSLHGSGRGEQANVAVREREFFGTPFFFEVFMLSIAFILAPILGVCFVVGVYAVVVLIITLRMKCGLWGLVRILCLWVLGTVLAFRFIMGW